MKDDKKIERLIKALDKVYPSTKQLIWRSFLQGVFVGLGTTIGASIVIAILTYILSRVFYIPVQYIPFLQPR